MSKAPEAAKSEWLGEFRNDLAAYIDPEIIEAAVDRDVASRPPQKCVVQAFAFIDPSGGMRDSFTCAIAHAEKDGEVLLDCLVEIKAPFNPTQATEQISATLKKYGITTAQSDKYGAAWVTDAFAKCGIAVRHSERDRSQIYLDCLPLFTAGRARLLDNRHLVSQFAGLERHTSPIGKDRVDHGLVMAASVSFRTRRHTSDVRAATTAKRGSSSDVRNHRPLAEAPGCPPRRRAWGNAAGTGLARNFARSHVERPAAIAGAQQDL